MLLPNDISVNLRIHHRAPETVITPVRGLIEIWEAWAQEAGRNAAERRDVALVRLHEFMSLRGTEFDLSGLNLTSLPPRFPPSIRILNLEFNALTKIPPALPDSLEILYLSHNHIDVVTGLLPASLQVLNISRNRVTEVTGILPCGLRELDLSGNQLSRVPDRLPSGLLSLTLCENLIGTVDVPLPESLEVVYLQDNLITALTIALPPRLRVLVLSSNRLSELNCVLPRTLRRLCLENNLFRTPLAFELYHPGTLQVTGGPYTDYPVVFPGESGDVADEGLPVEQVLFWFSAEERADRQPLWTSLLYEPGGATFAQFLFQLSRSRSATDAVTGSRFRVQVAAVLDRLAEDSVLRETVFQICEDAGTSCADRASLYWNNIQRAILLHQPECLDDAAFLTLSRQIFRMERLEEIAATKADEIRRGDPAFQEDVEVWLDFQTRLHAVLALPESFVGDMLFQQLSGVSETDIANAEEEVKNAERTGFLAWFTQWDVCHRWLKSSMTEEEQQILVQGWLAVFSARLEENVASLADMREDTDVIRLLGPRSQQEANAYIYIQHIKRIWPELFETFE